MFFRNRLVERLSSPGSPGRNTLATLPLKAKIAGGAVFGLIFIAVFAPLLAPFSPTETNVGPLVAGPSFEYIFGTDDFGRDVFSRVIEGTRVSITVGLTGTFFALVAGAVIGSIAATSHRVVNESIMRVIDVVMAFPGIVLAVTLAAILGAGLGTVILVLSILYTPMLARVVRANVLAQYGEDYVAAEKVMGAKRARILVRHVAINCAAPILVFATVIVADAIVLEASLSFVGLGIQPPQASWGNIISDGRDLIYAGGWWVTFFGGFAMFVAVLALNVFAEGLADALGAPKQALENRDEEKTATASDTDDGMDDEANSAAEAEANLAPENGSETVVAPVAAARRDDLLEDSDEDALLRIERLSIRFPDIHGPVEILSDISFDIGRNEVVGVVGESGCGKSLTGLAVMGLLPDNAEVSGSIYLEGRDLLTLKPRERRAMLGHEIAMIYQDALSSLNPGLTVGSQLKQLCKRGGEYTPGELLDLVHLPSGILGSYPNQLSGGQRQRVLIAMALSRKPSLLVADEPTTALDVTVQAQVVDLLRSLQAEMGFSIMLISHDLGLVSELADRAFVMYAGQLVEAGPFERVAESPRHPYTAGLLSSIVSLEKRHERLSQIPGVVPPPSSFPSGCRFAGRCANETEICKKKPDFERNGGSHYVACFHPVSNEAPPENGRANVGAEERKGYE